MLTVTIINPDRVVYDGPAEYVLVPTVHGTLGVLPSHTPIFAEITKGQIEIQGSNPQQIEVESGIMKVRSDALTILIGF